LVLTSRTLNDLAVSRWWLTGRQRAAYTVLAEVPPGASVSTWERFVPHLSLRREVFVFPVGIAQSDCVVVDGTILPDPRRLPDLRIARKGKEMTLSLRAPGGPVEYRYEILREAEGYLLLCRSSR
jgi:hypothetical protein